MKEGSRRIWGTEADNQGYVFILSKGVGAKGVGLQR